MNSKEKNIILDYAKSIILDYVLNKKNYQNNKIDIFTYDKYLNNFLHCKNLFIDLKMYDTYIDILNDTYLKQNDFIESVNNAYREIIKIFKSVNKVIDITDNNCIDSIIDDMQFYLKESEYNILLVNFNHVKSNKHKNILDINY